MRQQNLLIINLMIAIILLAVPASGQNKSENDGCNFCFRGKPKGNCCSFWIFESGILSRVSGSEVPTGKAKFLVTADLGLMFNSSKSSAFGGSLHLSADDNGNRFGFGLRYRKWLNERVALDLSPRILIAGTNNAVTNRYPGFAFSAALSFREWLSIDAYLDIIPYEQRIFLGPSAISTSKNTQTSLYLGASGRSWGALALPILLIIVAAATVDDYGTSF